MDRDGRLAIGEANSVEDAGDAARGAAGVELAGDERAVALRTILVARAEDASLSIFVRVEPAKTAQRNSFAWVCCNPYERYVLLHTNLRNLREEYL